MTDGEFWDYVLQGIEPGTPADEEDDWDAAADDTLGDLTSCPECGERGACAFDEQGRSLIHVIPEGHDA